MASNIMQRIRLKRAINIKQQNKLKEPTKIKQQKDLKGATNVTQHKNTNMSSSSSDCSSKQKKNTLRRGSSISTEVGSSTRSREEMKNAQESQGNDNDPKSMMFSEWEHDRVDPQNTKFDYNDFIWMQERNGVALPFFLPKSITERFIDLKEMGLGLTCNCPRIYIPVCSYNNITYVNECILNCVRAKKKRRNGPCISYRRKNERVYIVIPSDWNSSNKIKPQKRRSFTRRMFDKIKEIFKKFWNAVAKAKTHSTRENEINYHTTEGVRNYLMEYLTAMNYGDKIEEFSDNFLKIANKTIDMKDFADLFLQATYLADNEDFFDRFDTVIKSKENYEYYVKDMLIESLGYKFNERVENLFKKKVINDYSTNNTGGFKHGWKIAPTFNETL